MRLVSRNSVLLGALMATALAVPALAQQSGATKYADCPANFTPTQGEQDAARAAWILGKDADAVADYAKAIDYYKDAYKRDCTKHVLLSFIAKAYELKGDKAEAVNALETYLVRAPKADDVDQVKKHIENLKAQMATQPTTTATTTETAATPTATVTATSAPTGTETAPVTGERSHTAGPWVVFGIGAGAAIAGAVVTGVGGVKVADTFSECPDLNCPKSYTKAQLDAVNSRNASGRTLENVGVGVLIGGGALMIAGLVWHFVEPTGPKTTVTPVVGLGYGGFALQQRF
jgi:tetratricopeptide (TPR) repeat protein